MRALELFSYRAEGGTGQSMSRGLIRGTARIFYRHTVTRPLSLQELRGMSTTSPSPGRGHPSPSYLAVNDT